jgi:hypothetical protein
MTTSGSLTCCHQMKMVVGILVVAVRSSEEAGQEEASLDPSFHLASLVDPFQTVVPSQMGAVGPCPLKTLVLVGPSLTEVPYQEVPCRAAVVRSFQVPLDPFLAEDLVVPVQSLDQMVVVQRARVVHLPHEDEDLSSLEVEGLAYLVGVGHAFFVGLDLLEVHESQAVDHDETVLEDGHLD